MFKDLSLKFLYRTGPLHASGPQLNHVFHFEVSLHANSYSIQNIPTAAHSLKQLLKTSLDYSDDVFSQKKI